MKRNLLDLIKDELSSESNLVDVSGDLSLFEDQYGELHDWNNDSNIFHFLCRQLQVHYTKSVSVDRYYYYATMGKVLLVYWANTAKYIDRAI